MDIVPGLSKDGVIHEIGGELGGTFHEPGTYDAVYGIDLTGTLALVVPDDYKNVDQFWWTFRIGGAFVTASNSRVIFVNAAHEEISTDLSDKVNWDVTGAITLGAKSEMIGNMKSKADITLGAKASSGALYAAGSIKLGAEATASGIVTALVTVSLGNKATAEVVDPPTIQELLAIIGQYNTAIAKNDEHIRSQQKEIKVLAATNADLKTAVGVSNENILDLEKDIYAAGVRSDILVLRRNRMLPSARVKP
jgi:hypothetical protein